MSARIACASLRARAPVHPTLPLVFATWADNPNIQQGQPWSLDFYPPPPLPQAGSRQRTGGRKAWTGQRPRVFPWVFRLTSRVALGSKMRNARVRDSSSIWSRRPHPRRERERILGPSLITFGTIAPMLWGWANLKPALSSLGTDRSIAFTFYAVQLAGLFSLGCMA
jgi:hypothetical protein